MLDLIVRNARLARTSPNGRLGSDLSSAGHPAAQSGPLPDIGCKDGKIVAVAPALAAEAVEEIDAQGFLVTPPFVDSHFHLDSTLSYGRPQVNQSGTLLEGISLWGDLKPELTAEDVKQRAHALCRWAIAKGNLAIRSHVDICDPSLLAVEALLEVRAEIKPYLDLQLVAFPQDGFLRRPESKELLIRALDKGVDVVGGIPHFERTMAEGAESVRQLCELAADRGLLVDLHCDESDDPHSRHIESLVYQTQRLGLQGQVAGSHLTSMHSMDNYYVSKLLALMVEADLKVVANPLINITLQGRHDSYPKRRGMTRVKEQLAAGLTVAFGHDCVMDPWYPLGSHDMLEVAHMALHVGQLTGVDEMRACFAAVTQAGAETLMLRNYGLVVGCNADLVVLKANRLFVVRRGRLLAKSRPQTSDLTLGKQQWEVSFLAAESHRGPTG